MVPNLRLSEAVQLLPTDRVQINREHKANKEANQRHSHRLVVARIVGHQSRQSWEHCTSADRGHNPRRATLGMPSETTDREREDSREDARLEEEDQREHRNAGFAFGPDRRRDKDHDHGHEDHKDEAGFNEHEEAGGGETADGEEALSDGVAVGGGGFGDLGGFLGVSDELAGDRDLSAHVTELGSNAEKQFVLLAEGLVFVAGKARTLLSLESHVSVCYLRNRRKEEHNGQEEDKAGDS